MHLYSDRGTFFFKWKAPIFRLTHKAKKTREREKVVIKYDLNHSLKYLGIENYNLMRDMYHLNHSFCYCKSIFVNAKLRMCCVCMIWKCYLNDWWRRPYFITSLVWIYTCFPGKLLLPFEFATCINLPVRTFHLRCPHVKQ